MNSNQDVCLKMVVLFGTHTELAGINGVAVQSAMKIVEKFGEVGG